MENCVIYARFSSHGQNEQSIEAQVRICKEYAESKGLDVVNLYTDKARTGTNDARPAFQNSTLSCICSIGSPEIAATASSIKRC